MSYIASWKTGFGSLFRADAQLVANEIMSIGDTATPAQIVDMARDSSTELHKCFEWNDTVAAEKYRLEQARQVVRILVIKREDGQKDQPERRFFHKNEYSEGYKSLEFIVRNDTEYEKLLKQALAELHAFKAKYHALSELEEILALID